MVGLHGEENLLNQMALNGQKTRIDDAGYCRRDKEQSVTRKKKSGSSRSECPFLV